MQIFDPVASGIAAACQVMNYSHVEKDLSRNEHLILNLE